MFAIDTGQLRDKGKVSLWNMSLHLFPIIKKLKIEENYWLINVILTFSEESWEQEARVSLLWQN